MNHDNENELLSWIFLEMMIDLAKNFRISYLNFMTSLVFFHPYLGKIPILTYVSLLG